MAIINFLDYVTYPDMNQRINILDNYFNTSSLQLDIKPYLTLNNLSDEIAADFFDSRGLFYTVNRDLRETIRRYNNDVFYITDSMFKMLNYYELMNNSSSENERIIYETLFRKSARCVCSEIFMYEEKIKNLVRVILKFDKRKTKQYNVFKTELRKKAKHSEHIRSFRKAYNKYEQNTNILFVKKIRNDEIHNDSAIDEYTDIQEIAPGVVSRCNVYYVLSNDTLYHNIKQALKQQALLKGKLQLILNNHKL